MTVFQQLLVVCPLVFFAGFVDSIAGGGGIISLPAYYVAGLPPRMALGTNKFASTFGATISAVRFIRNKKVNLKAAVISAVAALIGAACGARLALYVSEVYLRYILLIALPLLAVFILKNKAIGNEKTSKDLSNRRVVILCILSGFIIGGYDGFFGPGTGTFLIIVFNSIIGFDLLTSSGNAKVVNLASNVASLITFLISGHIVFMLAIPAACSSIAGHYIGSQLALKNGAKIIRPAFVVVLLLLMLKVGFDLFG